MFASVCSGVASLCYVMEERVVIIPTFCRSFMCVFICCLRDVQIPRHVAKGFHNPVGSFMLRCGVVRVMDIPTFVSFGSHLSTC